MSLIIKQPHLCSVLEVWHPRYHDKWQDEMVVLLNKRKVDFGSPVLIVKFTKAKAFMQPEQRFAIKKIDAQACEVGDNGTAPMYIVPMSKLEYYETPAEIYETIERIFP